MITNSRDHEQFGEILRFYSEAESFIKEVELCVSEIAFLAINELRYSGHHLLKAPVSVDPEHCNKELSDTVSRTRLTAALDSRGAQGVGLIQTFD